MSNQSLKNKFCDFSWNTIYAIREDKWK